MISTILPRSKSKEFEPVTMIRSSMERAKTRLDSKVTISLFA